MKKLSSMFFQIWRARR